MLVNRLLGLLWDLTSVGEERPDRTRERSKGFRRMEGQRVRTFPDRHSWVIKRLLGAVWS